MQIFDSHTHNILWNKTSKQQLAKKTPKTHYYYCENNWPLIEHKFIIVVVIIIIKNLEHGMEKAMAPHSSTLAWKIPWMEEPGRLQSMGSLQSDTTERLHFHFPLSCIGEGNGNPLQCSCLENPRDGEAWWAAVYGVAQSPTWLSSRTWQAGLV